MKSINLKIILSFFLLLFIVISIFIMLIFENQIDLLVKNTETQSKEKVTGFIETLNPVIENFNQDKERFYASENILQDLKNHFDLFLKNYILFNENGVVYLNKNNDTHISAKDILNGRRAITNKDMVKVPFLAKIDISNYIVKFYIPLNIDLIDSPILLIKYKLNHINIFFNNMYQMTLFIIIVLFLFFIAFDFILLKILIFPILSLKKKSIEISNGNYSNRVIVKSKDEIGELGKSFNKMAISIEEKITSLKSEIERRTRAESKLKELSTMDHLTKLVNRRYFDEQLEKEISRSKRYGSIFSIILYDIDFFKHVNDNYGHDTGDSVLVEISRIAKEQLRTADILCRWGGEEFIVLLPGTNVEGARKAAEKIRKSTEEFNFVNVKKVTASFGVTEFMSNESKEEFLKRVDDFLYKAKKNGRNQVYGERNIINEVKVEKNN